MTQVNSKLINDIRTNKTPSKLLLSGEPNYGDLSMSPDLFWARFNEAFHLNTTIYLLALEKQNKDVIDNVSQILKLNNSKLTTLQLRQQDAPSIEKLLSALTNSNVDELVLERLDIASIKASIPALTDLN